MRPSRAELVVLGLLLVSAHGARGQAIGQGFELERAGQYQRVPARIFSPPAPATPCRLRRHPDPARATPPPRPPQPLRCPRIASARSPGRPARPAAPPP